MARVFSLGGFRKGKAKASPERRQRSDLENGLMKRSLSGTVSDVCYPNLAQEERTKCRALGLVHPDGQVYSLWHTSLLVLVGWCAWWTPLEFGLIPNPALGIMVFDALVDLLFLGDAVLNFFVARRNPKTAVLITDQTAIAKSYLMGGFIFDLLSIPPYNLFNYWATGAPASGALGDVFRFLPCLRLFRLPQVYHAFSLLGRQSFAAFFAIRVTKLVVNIILAAHYYAVFFFWITTLEPDPANTWIGQGYGPDWESASVFVQYVTAMFFSVFVITSIGPAYTPITTLEQILTMVYGLFGMAALAYTLGTLTVLMVKSTSTTQEYHQDMDALRRYTAQNSISPELEAQLKDHLQIQLLQRKGQTDSFLRNLPHHLRVAITRQLYLPVIENLSVFHGCSKQFLNQLVAEFESDIVTPNTIVTLAGDVATHLFIVVSGKLVREDGPSEAGTGRSRSSTQMLLLPGSVFGKSAVLCDVPQLFTVRAIEVSQLLRLSKSAFTTIMKGYPRDCAIIMSSLKKTLSSKADNSGVMRSASEQALGSEFDISVTELGAVASELQADIRGQAFELCSTGLWEQLKGLLAEHPSLINAADYNGRTLLHVAAAGGHTACIALLLEHGAEPNKTDNNGVSVLNEGAKAGHEGVIRALKQAGAELLIKDLGATLCRLAAAAGPGPGSGTNGSGGSSKGILVASGSSTGNRSSGEYLGRLLECGADPNAQDYSGCTALHIACSHGNATLVEMLMKHNADPSIRDQQGNSAVDIATRLGNQRVLGLLKQG